MEAEVLTKFLPDLVNAISDCVQAISDQCLSKGLVTRSTYDQVLESGAFSKGKARTLILAVQASTSTDSSCFDILLEILDEHLPPASKQKLLQEIRKEREDRANYSLALVPANSQQLSTELHVSPLTVARLEGAGHETIACQQCLQQKSFLLERFENSVSQLAYSSAQKNQLEKELESRTKESGRLSEKLEMLENQLKVNSLANEKELSSTQSRISACETEMSDLKSKIKELKCIIEEEGMQVKRGRNTIRMETIRIFGKIVQQSQQEIEKRKEECTEILTTKEQEYQKVLAEQEALLQSLQEEADVKVRELQHKVACLEKELLSTARLGQERQSRPPSSGHNIISPHSDQLGSSIPSLKDLLKELRSESHLWEDIGIQLEVNDEKLQQIRINNRESRICLREMLRIWLKESSFPSWAAIAEACDVLGYGSIADRVGAKYGFVTQLTEHHHDILLEQLSNFADRWRRIGYDLCFTGCELDSIEESNSAPIDCLSKMLLQWLQCTPGDARGSKNYPTLEMLRRALRMRGYEITACDLHL